MLRQLVLVSNAKDEVRIADLMTRTFRAIGSEDVFEMGDHILNTRDGIDNHSYTLIKLVIYQFFKLRQHQRAKINTENLNNFGFRQKLTKTILFSGQ